MPLTEATQYSPEESQKDSTTLTRALDELSVTPLPSELGLSSLFHAIVEPQAEIQRKCEDAMLALCETYVATLDQLNQEKNPEQAMQLLHLSEALWKSNTQTILQYDTEGTEKTFLLEMRAETATFLENYIAKTAENAFNKPTQEQNLLLYVLLETLNSIYSEVASIGYAPPDKIRERLAQIALHLL